MLVSHGCCNGLLARARERERGGGGEREREREPWTEMGLSEGFRALS